LQTVSNIRFCSPGVTFEESPKPRREIGDANNDLGDFFHGDSREPMKDRRILSIACRCDFSQKKQASAIVISETIEDEY
jgi:hypothetical protein